MKMAKRMISSLIGVLALVVFLICYSLLYDKVEAYALAHDLNWLTILYEAGMAFLPALYLRAMLAFLRKGERKKSQFAVDASGVVSTIILLVLGVWSIFSDTFTVLAGGAQAYYFTALWMAVLCCVQRVPRKEIAEKNQASSPVAQSQPDLFDIKPMPEPEPAFEALQETQPAANSIEVELPEV